MLYERNYLDKAEAISRIGKMTSNAAGGLGSYLEKKQKTSGFGRFLTKITNYTGAFFGYLGDATQALREITSVFSSADNTKESIEKAADEAHEILKSLIDSIKKKKLQTVSESYDEFDEFDEFINESDFNFQIIEFNSLLEELYLQDTIDLQLESDIDILIDSLEK